MSEFGFITSLPSREEALNNLAVKQILSSNEVSSRFGLILTKEDAVYLVEKRKESLKAVGRVEVGSGTIDKLIFAFCNSTYINQDEYEQILEELIETFYYLKNDTLDEISDDELIQLMRNYYENSCHGSMELLQSRELMLLSRKIRYQDDGYYNLAEEIAYDLDYNIEEDEF